MAMLPGWNSLEAVGSIGHSLHMAAIVVLALLVVAEGLALVYDDRKYALVGAAERETIVSREQEALAVTERRHHEIVALQRELEEAQRQQAYAGDAQEADFPVNGRRGDGGRQEGRKLFTFF
jgi:phosphoenolpyruvate-protein kinase (PTS system EI component)